MWEPLRLWDRCSVMKKLIISVAVVTLVTGCAEAEVASTTTSISAVTTSTMPTASTTSTLATTSSTSTNTSTPSPEAWDTWTLVLASIETGEAGSEDRALEIASGIDGADVLYSSDVPSLNPGFWVVHWGEFESGSEASNRCAGWPTLSPAIPATSERLSLRSPRTAMRWW